MHKCVVWLFGVILIHPSKTWWFCFSLTKVRPFCSQLLKLDIPVGIFHVLLIFQGVYIIYTLYIKIHSFLYISKSLFSNRDSPCFVLSQFTVILTEKEINHCEVSVGQSSCSINWTFIYYYVQWQVYSKACLKWKKQIRVQEAVGEHIGHKQTNWPWGKTKTGLYMHKGSSNGRGDNHQEGKGTKAGGKTKARKHEKTRALSNSEIWRLTLNLMEETQKNQQITGPCQWLQCPVL